MLLAEYKLSALLEQAIALLYPRAKTQQLMNIANSCQFTQKAADFLLQRMSDFFCKNKEKYQRELEQLPSLIVLWAYNVHLAPSLSDVSIKIELFFDSLPEIISLRIIHQLVQLLLQAEQLRLANLDQLKMKFVSVCLKQGFEHGLPDDLLQAIQLLRFGLMKAVAVQYKTVETLFFKWIKCI